MSIKLGKSSFDVPLCFVFNNQEAYIAELDAKSGASLKLTILNSKGRIWTMVAGGGASVVYRWVQVWMELTRNDSDLIIHALDLRVALLAYENKTKLLVIQKKVAASYSVLDCQHFLEISWEECKTSEGGGMTLSMTSREW